MQSKDGAADGAMSSNNNNKKKNNKCMDALDTDGIRRNCN